MIKKIELFSEGHKNTDVVKEHPELPAEVWVKIFSHLDIKDFCHIIELEKFFSSFSSDEQIWASMLRFFTQYPHTIKFMDGTDSSVVLNVLADPEKIHKYSKDPNNPIKKINIKEYIRQKYPILRSIVNALKTYDEKTVSFSEMLPTIKSIIAEDFDVQLKFVLEHFKVSSFDTASIAISSFEKSSPRSLMTLLNYLKFNCQIDLSQPHTFNSNNQTVFLDLSVLLRNFISSYQNITILLHHGAKHFTKEGCTIEYALDKGMKEQAIRIIQSLSHEELIAEIEKKMISWTLIPVLSLFITAITKPVSDKLIVEMIKYVGTTPNLELILKKCQKNQLTSTLLLMILNQTDEWFNSFELSTILPYFTISPDDIELLKLAIEKDNSKTYSPLINHFLKTGIDVTKSVESIQLFVLAIKFLNNLNLMVIDYYLQKKFDVNSKYDGEPILHIAIRIGNIDLINKLLHFGANVNCKNDKGKTALHITCAAQNIEMVNSLISAGADINAVDDNGETPLGIAIVTKNIHLLSILLKHGAVVNEVDFHKACHLCFIHDRDKQFATIVNLLTRFVNNTPYDKLRDEKNELLEVIKKQQEEIVKLKEQLDNKNNNNNTFFKSPGKAEPSKEDLRSNRIKHFAPLKGDKQELSFYP